MSLFLAVILFHNDEEIVEEQINHMLSNKHDIIIFNHNSTDNTGDLIKKKANEHSEIKKIYDISKDIPFINNGVFKYISQILIDDYSHKYDWITFVESDEFLEGPKRDKNYYEYLLDVSKTSSTYIQFDNMLFWFTVKDDPSIKSVRKRIKHYSYYRNCGPRIYAWKAKYTNIRRYNHNKPINAKKYPIHFNTCHYPFTSIHQMERKLIGRSKLSNRMENSHYKKLHNTISNEHKRRKLIIEPKQLHYDDGSDLIKDDKINWYYIYF